MELCTSTNIYHERANGERVPVEESMRLCAQAGYRALDLCFVDLVLDRTPFVGEHWRAYIQSLGDLARRLGVRFVQSHAPLDDFLARPSEERRQWTRRAAEASAMLGVSWMVAHPATLCENGALSPKTHAGNVDYFRWLCGVADGLRLGVALENMWGATPEGLRRYAAQPAELCRLCDDVGSPNLGVCWDTMHAAAEGIDQREGLMTVGGRLRALHISDLRAGGDIHILPYMGQIDWAQTLDALRQLRYAGPFAFELQHYLLSMPASAVPAALALSRAVGEAMTARGA